MTQEIPSDPSLYAPPPAPVAELMELHARLFGLQQFIRMNYHPNEKPPSDQDLVAIMEYIERVVAKMQKTP